MSMKLYCQAGKHEWERPPQRGRPPLNCPEHAKAKPAPLPRRPEENSADRMARLRERKAQKAQEREEMARLAEVERLIELRATLPSLCEAYDAAFDAANRENTPEAWHRADMLQARIINTRKAIRDN